jgi:hypothetical protein
MLQNLHKKAEPTHLTNSRNSNNIKSNHIKNNDNMQDIIIINSLSYKKQDNNIINNKSL